MLIVYSAATSVFHYRIQSHSAINILNANLYSISGEKKRAFVSSTINGIHPYWLDDGRAYKRSYRKTSGYLVQHHLTIVVVTVARLSSTQQRLWLIWNALARALHTICKHALRKTPVAASGIEKTTCCCKTPFDRVLCGSHEWMEQTKTLVVDYMERRASQSQTHDDNPAKRRGKTAARQTINVRDHHGKTAQETRFVPLLNRTILRLNIARTLRTSQWSAQSESISWCAAADAVWAANALWDENWTARWGMKGMMVAHTLTTKTTHIYIYWVLVCSAHCFVHPRWNALRIYTDETVVDTDQTRYWNADGQNAMRRIYPRDARDRLSQNIAYIHTWHKEQIHTRGVWGVRRLHQHGQMF